ncbi:MAG: hypothetical protein ACSLFK_02185 [Gemmatimonadaceae bacterium]
MLPNLTRLLTPVLVLAMVTACAPAGRNTGQSVDAFLASGAVTTVTVNNQQPSDMKVYVVAGSAEHRLGLVSALSRATFGIPSVIPSPSDVRFVAVPLASGESQSTDLITVFAGDGVVFTIGHGPGSSNLILRR